MIPGLREHKVRSNPQVSWGAKYLLPLHQEIIVPYRVLSVAYFFGESPTVLVNAFRKLL